jgi:glucosamine 6-phosphate synthetase-like amidotransferase/phosphosugar isomerase protein
MEIASEFRYRKSAVRQQPDDHPSQSGETADTLAALRSVERAGLSRLAGHLQRAGSRWCVNPIWR